MTKSKGQLSKEVRGGISPPTRLLNLEWDECKKSFGLFDLTAPGGNYAIDSFAHSLPLASSWHEQENSPGQNSLHKLRSSIESSAHFAAIRAQNDLEGLPRARARAMQGLSDLKKAARLGEKAVKILQRPEVSWALSDESQIGPAGSLVSLNKFARAIREIKSAVGQWEVLPPQPSRFDPFTRYFIQSVFGIWRKAKGRPPGISANGPFVKLLAAAWKDLQLPIPEGCSGDEQDLIRWLGERAVKEIPRLRAGYENSVKGRAEHHARNIIDAHGGSSDAGSSSLRES
jgi:hypothetical protein